MTNFEIEKRLRELTTSERKITAEIVGLIREADHRRLYLERGFPSLFDWLIKTFNYSSSAAYRRIQAARLLKDLPDIKEKLEGGSLNLTILAQVHTAVRNEEKSGGAVSVAQKAELVSSIENKSAADTQKILADTFPASAAPKESLRHIANDDSSLTIVLNKEDREALERVKQIMAHTNPDASWGEVVGYALKYVTKSRANKPAASTQQAAAAEARCVKGRAAIRRQILSRGCEFQDPLSKKVCGSHFQTEVDHIVPRAKGGGDNSENLRCLCRRHNILMAERHFGRAKMEKFRRRP